MIGIANTGRPALRWAVLAFGLVSALEAREPCTNHDFQGSFGFFGAGTVVRSPVTILTGPFARLGRFSADGEGKMLFSSTASFNGVVFPQDFDGTYTMSPDCTFKALVNLPDPINLQVTFRGMLSDDFNETRDLFIEPAGVVVWGVGRKMKLSSCSNRDLRGAFQWDMQGSFQVANNRRETYASLARIEMDGDGNFSGRFSTNNEGNSKEEDITGTYSMASNCIFEMKYCTAGRGTPCTQTTVKGALTDRGAGAYVMILNPEAATVTGTMKLQ